MKGSKPSSQTLLSLTPSSALTAIYPRNLSWWPYSHLLIHFSPTATLLSISQLQREAIG